MIGDSTACRHAAASPAVRRRDLWVLRLVEPRTCVPDYADHDRAAESHSQLAQVRAAS